MILSYNEYCLYHQKVYILKKCVLPEILPEIKECLPISLTNITLTKLPILSFVLGGYRRIF